MADFGRGIKAGIVASVLYSLAYGLILLAIPTIVLGDIWSPFWQSYWMIIALSAVVFAAVGGIMFGIIWGVIYAALYDSIPLKSPIVKGIILGVLYWLVVDVFFSIAYAGSILYLIFSFVLGAVVFGSLLGFFWRVFGGSGEQTCPSPTTFLVSQLTRTITEVFSGAGAEKRLFRLSLSVNGVRQILVRRRPPSYGGICQCRLLVQGVSASSL